MASPVKLLGLTGLRTASRISRSASRPVFHGVEAPPSSRRALSTSVKAQWPKNPTEDRNNISTESNEYSKSGGDATSAQQDRAAFTPGINDPEEQRKEAGKGNEVNPLDASPANTNLGRPRPETEAEPESSPSEVSRERSSGGGSPPKHGKLG